MKNVFIKVLSIDDSYFVLQFYCSITIYIIRTNNLTKLFDLNKSPINFVNNI